MHIHFIRINFHIQFAKPPFRTDAFYSCVGEAVSPRNLSRVFIASAANHSRAVKARYTRYVFDIREQTFDIVARYTRYRVPSRRNEPSTREGGGRGGRPRGFRIKCYKLQRRATCRGSAFRANDRR